MYVKLTGRLKNTLLCWFYAVCNPQSSINTGFILLRYQTNLKGEGRSHCLWAFLSPFEPCCQPSTPATYLGAAQSSVSCFSSLTWPKPNGTNSLAELKQLSTLRAPFARAAPAGKQQRGPPLLGGGSSCSWNYSPPHHTRLTWRKFPATKLPFKK